MSLNPPLQMSLNPPLQMRNFCYIMSFCLLTLVQEGRNN
ncbi:hypothetical protein MC7420_5942 [Coleofasciculus chthonoplastes PCC 7420]|uniref:Uncharacterized protein n=1 Tax=Coleofasciculus chthonoplastes PCC 7420 TaxID=118168 RepID=B4VW61_9CYAN|nr:hypothetical protein MC7420_5942 [Coleofasciculus chthonoplastes PCC 7420]